MKSGFFRSCFVLTTLLGSFGSARLGAQSPQVFVSVTPCRVLDTRLLPGPFGGPILQALTARTFQITQGACGIPPNATAYLLNVTAVPTQSLGYLTIWPAGQPQPLVSTLNAANAQPTANSATVMAGTNGGVSVFVSDQTHLILDINGYYVPQPNFSDGETPAGVADGANTTFTLAHTPLAYSKALITCNGVVQKMGADYTLTGATITFVSAPTPADVLQVWYRY